MAGNRKRSDGEEVPEGPGTQITRQGGQRTLKVLPITGGLLVEFKFEKEMKMGLRERT